MAWYNYRRVPAVTLAKQLIAEGALGEIFHYRAKFLQGLDDFCRCAARRPRYVAARRRRRGQRSHRRSARALHRYRDLAQRRHRLRHGDDANLRKGAAPHGYGRVPGRWGRRCQCLSRPLSQRLPRDLRSDALRARPQSTLHVRDQRRACVARVGLARSASLAMVRPRRWQSCARLALDSRERRRPSLHQALVGAGLQIGYEHSFVHQIADFLRGLQDGVPAAPTFAMRSPPIW